MKRRRHSGYTPDAQCLIADQADIATSFSSLPPGLTFSLDSCDPKELMAQLHDRMPVILAEIDWPKWLGEEPASEQDLLAVLKPCPNEALQIWPVDKMVGNVRNNGPQLILPVLSDAIPA